MADATRDGHWQHDWIPLDAAAAKQKGHGHIPGGWKPPEGMSFYHGTNAELQPGDHLNTNYGWAHATTSKFTAASYARLRNGQNVYEVEPLGPIEKDDRTGQKSNYRTQHGFRVKRKLGESADDLYFGNLMGGPAKRSVAMWTARWQRELSRGVRG